ncbi:unnamed protein product, partial [Prorocentrum cordatum]
PETVRRPPKTAQEMRSAPAPAGQAVRKAFVAPVAASPSAGAMPRHQLLYSPKHVQLSPSSGASMASTMASATLLTSPMAIPLKGPLWPSSPVVASPRAPAPIPRDTLLQARTMVQRAEQGPPGLATCAPTPTTKACAARVPAARLDRDRAYTSRDGPGAKVVCARGGCPALSRSYLLSRGTAVDS